VVNKEFCNSGNIFKFSYKFVTRIILWINNGIKGLLRRGFLEKWRRWGSLESGFSG